MATAQDRLLLQLAQLDQRYAELEGQIAGQAGAAHRDPRSYQSLTKELADLRELVSGYRTYARLGREAAEADVLAAAQGDAEMRELARDETVLLRKQQAETLAQLERQWAARHQEPERPILVEIRPGTGGLEAGLFVGDLYRMYQKYGARRKLTVEPIAGQTSEVGGLKEMVFAVKGPGAWKYFKYESGVHRVQRVPSTEAQGRIHTSTVTVAVMPEPEDVELSAIPAKDLQIDVYRASGPGGQGVNTTDSAVRIRHLPTGLMVTCQDERSQLRNKDKAMRVLRARLLDQMQQQRQQQIASDRRKQVGTGDRSEKIRTYNFPDRRVTDHRIGLTLHKLDLVMEGALDEVVDALITHEQDKLLEGPGA